MFPQQFSVIKLSLFILAHIMPLSCRGTHFNASSSQKFPSKGFMELFGSSASTLGVYPAKDIFVDDTGILHSLASQKDPDYDFSLFFGQVQNSKGYSKEEVKKPESYPHVDNPGIRGHLSNGRSHDPSYVKEEFENLTNEHLAQSGPKTNRNKAASPLGSIRNNILQHLDNKGSEISRQFSSMNFPSIEAALLSLAFLTFAVFLIDLVQDLIRGSSTGRKRRGDEGVDDGMTDLIVLTLSSIDTLSYGSQNPNCGQKLLCHLNRSGWHDGLLGTASNYFVSLILSVFSPKSGFQNNLDAAQFGKESDECTDRYSACPSVLADLLPT